MKRSLPSITLLALAAGGAALLAACATREESVPANVLLAARVATPPTLDGLANDAAWAGARALKVSMADGMNFADGKGATTATLKAVVQRRPRLLPDPVRRPDAIGAPRPVPEAGRRLVEEAEGSERQGWRRQRLLRRQVGDDLEHQQLDRAASTKRVVRSRATSVKASRSATSTLAREGQLGDMWHMKSMRTGAARQGRRPVPRPHALRRQEVAQRRPQERPGRPRVQGLRPGRWQAAVHEPRRQGRPTPAARTTSSTATRSPFDDSKFKAGDEVASYLIFALKGDRADIDVATRWSTACGPPRCAASS